MIDGRIILGVGGRYQVMAGERIFVCGVRGIFRKKNIKPMIGDYVAIDEGEAIIVEIKERINQLVRPRVANVDQIVIVFAATDPVMDFYLCDKLIIAAEAAGITPVIVVNKIDLSGDFYGAEEYKKIGYEFFAVSTVKGIGLSNLLLALDNKVSAFAGPSGVGKSSIINKIISSAKMETGELSKKLARGKHTTRHVELIPLHGSGFVIDTPGFSAIDIDGILHDKSDISIYFKEFHQYSGMCRFDDCKHLAEPGCALRAHIGTDISERRYRHYVELCKIVWEGD